MAQGLTKNADAAGVASMTENLGGVSNPTEVFSNATQSLGGLGMGGSGSRSDSGSGSDVDADVLADVTTCIGDIESTILGTDDVDVSDVANGNDITGIGAHDVDIEQVVGDVNVEDVVNIDDVNVVNDVLNCLNISDIADGGILNDADLDVDGGN